MVNSQFNYSHESGILPGLGGGTTFAVADRVAEGSGRPIGISDGNKDQAGELVKGNSIASLNRTATKTNFTFDFCRN